MAAFQSAKKVPEGYKENYLKGQKTSLNQFGRWIRDNNIDYLEAFSGDIGRFCKEVLVKRPVEYAFRLGVLVDFYDFLITKRYYECLDEEGEAWGERVHSVKTWIGRHFVRTRHEHGNPVILHLLHAVGDKGIARTIASDIMDTSVYQAIVSGLKGVVAGAAVAFIAWGIANWSTGGLGSVAWSETVWGTVTVIPFLIAGFVIAGTWTSVKERLETQFSNQVWGGMVYLGMEVYDYGVYSTTQLLKNLTIRG